MILFLRKFIPIPDFCSSLSLSYSRIAAERIQLYLYSGVTKYLGGSNSYVHLYITEKKSGFYEIHECDSTHPSRLRWRQVHRCRRHQAGDSRVDEERAERRRGGSGRGESAGGRGQRRRREAVFLGVPEHHLQGSLNFWGKLTVTLLDIPHSHLNRRFGFGFDSPLNRSEKTLQNSHILSLKICFFIKTQFKG
ncbi:hypothetical protein CEXT_9041 [Caerostris extrusa]|uniref:Uncharacterized protein n=1 Tax=Caerostris extrusa TaxID=172846 RepID=A0AAV4UAE9_CAEEX|nr:hypothetical protein CEXT_9041 [Caerostris extrusa]